MARRSTKTTEAATETTTATVATETTEEAAKAEATNAKVDMPEEKKYPLSRLAAHCQKLFGVPSSTFAGATANLLEGSYSKSEIEAIINEWKKKEAK